MKLPPIKIQLITFLSIFAIYLSSIGNDVTFLPAVFISVISAVFLDSLATYLRTKHFIITDSSVISGLIIGYVISSQEPWWKFLFASVFAIGSKHLLRIKNKHLFNPAAFGILSSVILLGAATQWKGTNLWYILVPAGIYFVQKIHKLDIVIGYLVSSLILFGTHTFIQKLPLLDVLKFQNYFFIFIMLIEPKTTPIGKKGKIIFGIAVAALVFILTLCGVAFDAELLCLLILNLAVPALNKLPHWPPILTFPKGIIE
ncbi:MAG: RnfABCDGE type electron transport complex subunit D [Candidatus Omnitrophota bacterium]|nr:RnfABCDGE type electron transport complex subunit D [Candidatus Omnitrophota bacterium]